MDTDLVRVTKSIADRMLCEIAEGDCSCHMPAPCGVHQVAATEPYGQAYEAFRVAARYSGYSADIVASCANTTYDPDFALHSEAERWAMGFDKLYWKRS